MSHKKIPVLLTRGLQGSGKHPTNSLHKWIMHLSETVKKVDSEHAERSLKERNEVYSSIICRWYIGYFHVSHPSGSLATQDHSDYS